MRLILALLVALPLLSQETTRRLEWFHWQDHGENEHQLSWMVTEGRWDPATKQFQQQRAIRWLIDAHAATMTVGAETRAFDSCEAALLHMLMDLLTRYVVGSVNWWEKGHGVPVGPPATPQRVVPAQ